MEIRVAESKEELDEIKSLIEQYHLELNEDLCFQNFSKEMDEFPGKYSPPSGFCLGAYQENEIVGCVCLRKFDQDAGEVKRLYVTPQGRGKKTGFLLMTALIEKAKTMGYKKLLLDTLQRLEAANKLYEKLHFREITPYYHNPIPDVIYWELNLQD